MTHALVILNPNARSGYAARRDRHEITAKIQSLPGVSEVEWRTTTHPGHGIQLAQEATEQGSYGYIFAAGGDGTISEVINGIMRATVNCPPDERPIFGVLPWGTLNDFYMALEESEKAHPENGTLPLDVGHVHLDAMDAFCSLSISIGLSSWANMQYQQASHRFGRLLGLLPAVLNTLLTYRRAPRIRLSLDHTSAQTRRMLSMAIGNCPSVGGGVRLTPEAKIDDGWFDLSIIREVSLPRLALLLVTARLRRYYHSSAVEMTRFQYIELNAGRPVSVHLDGEMVPNRESQVKNLTLKVLPAALQVMRPSSLR